MKIITLLLVFLSLNSYSQIIQTDSVTTLNQDIKETSGLIFLNDKLITINDSGNSPTLYEIDTLSGNVSREVFVSNATNVDWESICFDDNYIYIADIGNNLGSRQDLKVYRLSIYDYVNTPNDTVVVDTIAFNYANQTSFTPQQYSTNFDAETLISFNDSLYVFTKNWGNSKTNIYALPKIPGNYSVALKDSIDTQGLITDAEYNPVLNELILIGHNINTPYVIKISSFSSDNFANGVLIKNYLNVTGSFQTESICLVDNFTFYISSEKYSTLPSTLSRFSSLEFVNNNEIHFNDEHFVVYPNPATNYILLNNQKGSVLRIISVQGQVVFEKIITSNQEKIDVHFLSKGLYFYQLKTSNGQLIIE